MTAAEIIELIKKLPPQEKAEVIAYLTEKVNRVEEATAERTVRYIPLEDAQGIAEEIFDRHSGLFKKLAQ